MQRQRIDKLGSVGLNTDVAPTSLPIEAWTSLSNVVTEDGAIRSAQGQYKLFDLPIRPLYHGVHQIGSQIDSVSTVIVSDGASVYAVAMNGVAEDITPTAPDPGVLGYPGGLGLVSFAVLNGVLVVNSRTAGPFYWAGPGNVLAPLPGWPSGWRCERMVAFGYFLVALGMEENGDVFPHKLRWSNSAQAGALPTLWTPAADNDAGDAILGDTPGPIVNAVLLRDLLVVVKTDALHSLTYIGGTFIMQPERLTGGVGTRVPLGVAVMKGATTIFTVEDLLFFDGQNTVSLVEQRIRRGIREAISEDFWASSVLFAYPQGSLLVLGLVGAGHTRLTHALIHNTEENTWGHRALTNSYGFDIGQIAAVSSGASWDDLGVASQEIAPRWAAGKTWDEQKDGSWNKGSYQPSTADLLLYESSDDDTQWWLSAVASYDGGSDGLPRTCTAARLGVPVGGADRVVMITRLWPELIANIPVDFWVGVQQTNNGDVTWQGPFTMTPGGSPSITPRLTGRYLCLKVESNEVGRWRLPALTVEYETAGDR